MPSRQERKTCIKQGKICCHFLGFHKNCASKTTKKEGALRMMTQLFWPIPATQMFNSTIRPSSSSTLLLASAAVRWRENAGKIKIAGGQSNGKKKGEWRRGKRQNEIDEPKMNEERREGMRRRVVEEIEEWEQNWRRKKVGKSYFGALFGVLAILLLIPCQIEAIRCYCTDEHCVPYGVCEANVCLVGLLRSSNAVIRTCGNQPLGCQRNVDRWSHLCSCDDNFCNTFLFLKASTSIDGPRGRSGNGNRDSGDHRIFERVDPPPGEFATFDHNSADDDGPVPIKNSNLLTLLLVIVPLSVGAAAVVVVAINYYCHLC